MLRRGRQVRWDRASWLFGHRGISRRSHLQLIRDCIRALGLSFAEFCPVFSDGLYAVRGEGACHSRDGEAVRIVDGEGIWA